MRVNILAPVSHEPEGEPHLKFAPGEHDVPDELARKLIAWRVAEPVAVRAAVRPGPAPKPEPKAEE